MQTPTHIRRTLGGLSLMVGLLISACSTTPAPDNLAAKAQTTVITLPGLSEAQALARYPGAQVEFSRTGTQGFTVLRVQGTGQSGALSSLGLTQREKGLNPLVRPNGARVWSDGARVWSDGARVWSDGARVWSDGARVWSDGAIVWSDGAIVWSDGAIVWSDSNGQHVVNDLAFEETNRNAGGGEGQIVAVLDSGLETDHPLFAGRLAPQNLWQDYIDGDTNPQEAGGSSYGHGTGMAGLVAQFAPKAKILPIRVLGPQGGDADTVAQAIADTADKGVNVINLSLGTAEPSPAIMAAIRYAQGKGITVLASAGNTGSATMDHPAEEMTLADGSVSVGSRLPDGTPTSYSSGGARAEALMPGTLISAFPGGLAAIWEGTSGATAVASGLAAAGLNPTELGDGQHGVFPRLP